MALFAKISKQAVASMDANRDRVQSWFDGDPLMHGPDRELRGTTIPKALLCWGGASAKPLVLDAASMGKDYRSHQRNALFIFWDVEPTAVFDCLSRIDLPEMCIGCGRTADVETVPARLFGINTIPDSTSHYRLRSGAPPFGPKLCPDCKSTPLVRIGYQDRGRFLTVGIGGIESAKAYRAIVEANHDHMAPYFEATYTAKLDSNRVVEALRKRKS